MKSLKGEGRSVRAAAAAGQQQIPADFVRTGDDYLILAIALDHDSDMDSAVQNAKDRLKEREG